MLFATLCSGLGGNHITKKHMSVRFHLCKIICIQLKRCVEGYSPNWGWVGLLSHTCIGKKTPRNKCRQHLYGQCSWKRKFFPRGSLSSFKKKNVLCHMLSLYILNLAINSLLFCSVETHQSSIKLWACRPLLITIWPLSNPTRMDQGSLF